MVVCPNDRPESHGRTECLRRPSADDTGITLIEGGGVGGFMGGGSRLVVVALLG